MNIFGYLEWRGDVPLKVSPFNEVDNLVLAELAYTDFGGIVPGNGESISISEAFTRFFQDHSPEELLAARSYTAKAPILMEEMCRGARFADTRLALYQNRRDAAAGMQFGAVTFLLPDGTAYAAFRGTDGTLVGWKEDFRLSYLSGTESQKQAAAYLDEAAGALCMPMRVGGHSKGGNLAVYAASCCSRQAQNVLQTVYTNDGPGFRPEFLEQEGYQRILPRVVSIVPEDSVIGLMMASGSTPRVIRSSASGITQHDGFSWETGREAFIPGELSNTSQLIRQMLDGWLDRMDDEARKNMTDTVFGLLEATGEETFSGISESRWHSIGAVASSIRKLPKGSIQELGKLLTRLGQSGARAASSYLSGRTSAKVQGMAKLPKMKTDEAKDSPSEETDQKD